MPSFSRTRAEPTFRGSSRPTTRCRPIALEREREQGSGRLRRVALAVPVRVDHEADLPLTVHLALPEERDARDDLAALPENGRGAQPLSLRPEGGSGNLECEELAALGERARLVIEPAGVALVGVDRVERVQVVGTERPQEQALGAERPSGCVHRRTVGDAARSYRRARGTASSARARRAPIAANATAPSPGRDGVRVGQRIGDGADVGHVPGEEAADDESGGDRRVRMRAQLGRSQRYEPAAT